MNLDKT